MEPTHFVLPRGNMSGVKEADFFRGQGGLTEDWGKHWLPIVVPPERRDSRRDPHGLGMARRIGAHLPPIKGWQRRLPHLAPDKALDPSSSEYQQVADRGLI